MLHTSVMRSEALELLDVHSHGAYIDCTLGAGGHALDILERCAPDGRLLALDLDQEAIAHAEEALIRAHQRLVLVHANFRHIARVAHEHGFDHVDGILYDLGFSCDMIKLRGRGLSFLNDEPLDMRFDQSLRTTAADILQTESVSELERIFREYGQERFAGRIARAIVREREAYAIEMTKQLVGIIVSAIPARFRHGRIHCATRTFQALRIAVNDELAALQESLTAAWQLVAPHGRVVVLSYHSLEDGIAKSFFRGASRSGQGTVLTKKPRTPSREEILKNPSARSAKLRAIQKT